MDVGTSAMVQTELDCIVNQYTDKFSNPFLTWGRYRKGLFKTTLTIIMKYWIMPISADFEDLNTNPNKDVLVVWRTHTKFNIGDIAYFYIKAPEKRIGYRLQVNRTNLPSKDFLSGKLDYINHEYYATDDKKPSTFIEYSEGTALQVLVNRYERNRTARDMRIASKGCKCAVCGMDFEKVYGEIGKGFIHVYHTIPISSIGKDYEIDPERDLVPVCPNCHAMLHRQDPPLTVSDSCSRQRISSPSSPPIQ